MKHNNIAFFIPHRGCPHQCSFCDQRTISGQQQAPTPALVTQTCRQALLDIPTAQARKNTEIAFFGGSFTAIPAAEMRAYLTTAQPFVGGEGFSGIRISTRPDAVTPEILSFLKSFGVTAVELGVQSLNDTVLRRNGRGHTAAEAIRAAGLIRDVGLSLGLQMMTGLYGDTPQTLAQTVEAILALKPDTLRIYPVAVLRGTDLAALYESGRYRMMPFDGMVTLCAFLLRFFTAHGIRVIRLGLHAQPEIEQKLVAGYYHPAFRELCESRLWLHAALATLNALQAGRDGLTAASASVYSDFSAEAPNANADSFFAPGETDGVSVAGGQAAMNRFLVSVHPKNCSKMIGQKRENIKRLEEQGFFVTVQTDASLPLDRLKAAVSG